MKAGREVLENIEISENEQTEFAELVVRLREGLKLYSNSQPFRLFGSNKHASQDLAHCLSELRENAYFTAALLKEQLTSEEYESLFRLPATLKAASLGLDKTTVKLGEVFELWFSCTYPSEFSLHGNREAAIEAMWAIITNVPRSLTSLDLSDNDIGHEGALPLILLLKTPTLRSLNLSGNNIYRGFSHIYNQTWYGQDVMHLGNALAENSSLKSLDLSYNAVDIRSRFVVEGLANGLARNNSIVDLNLAGCGIDLGAGSNFPVLTKALAKNTSIRRLNLANNNIDRGGADALIAMLQGAA